MRAAVWVGAMVIIAGSGLTAAERKESPDLRLTLEGHRGEVTAIAFNGKGDEVATGAGNGIIRVWNTKSGALVAKRDEFKGISITGLSFSPDGTILAASGKGKVGMWSITEVKSPKLEPGKSPMATKNETKNFKWVPFPSTDSEAFYSDIGVTGDGKEVYFARRHTGTSFPGKVFRYDKARDVTEERPGPRFFDPRSVACISDPESGVAAVYGTVGERGTTAILLYGFGDTKTITRGVPPLTSSFKLTDQSFTSLRNARMPEIVLMKVISLKDKEFSREELQKEIARVLVWFKLTDQAVLALRNAKVPDTVLMKLSPLKDKELSHEDFQKEVAGILTAEEAKQFQDVILNGSRGLLLTPEETKQLQDIILTFATVTKEAPSRITYSTDGKWLGAYSGTLAVWPVPGSQIISGDPGPATLENVYAAAIGPDNLLATVAPPNEFQNAVVTIWKLEVQTKHLGIFGVHWRKQFAEAKKVASFPTLFKEVGCLAFSPDGNTLAVGGSKDGVVQLWNMDDK